MRLGFVVNHIVQYATSRMSLIRIKSVEITTRN